VWFHGVEPHLESWARFDAGDPSLMLISRKLGVPSAWGLRLFWVKVAGERGSLG
jgi:hypothetical protein